MKKVGLPAIFFVVIVGVLSTLLATGTAAASNGSDAPLTWAFWAAFLLLLFGMLWVILSIGRMDRALSGRSSSEDSDQALSQTVTEAGRIANLLERLRSELGHRPMGASGDGAVMDSAAIESGFARLEADIKRLSAEISTLRSVLQGSDQEAMGRVATSARTPTQSAGAEKAVPSAARIPKAVAPEEAYKQTQAMAVETVRSFEEVRESTRQIREDLARTLAQPSGNVTAASQRLVSELMDTLVNRFGLEPLNPAPGAVLKRQEMVVERTETAALGVPGRVVRTIVPGWRYQGVVIDKARVIATPLVEG